MARVLPWAKCENFPSWMRRSSILVNKVHIEHALRPRHLVCRPRAIKGSILIPGPTLLSSRTTTYLSPDHLRCASHLSPSSPSRQPPLQLWAVLLPTLHAKLVNNASSSISKATTNHIRGAGCNGLAVACYAGAGFTFGVTIIGLPPAIMACNAGLGVCMATCATVALFAPTP